MSLAPIALFVYNRLAHTRVVIEALKKNNLAKESDLIIFSDGPKDEKDVFKVEEVRVFLKNVSGFKSVKIKERNKNIGLAESIITGVTEVVNTYGKIIVLEDDLVTSSDFLTYMNHALELYKHDEEVISIHGYIYPVKKILPKTFFLKGADCWGWATWKRGWDLFERDGQKLYSELEKRKAKREFDFYDGYPFMQMLKMQILGLNNSWAIRWYASAFLKNKLTLYPGTSFIKNIGLDGSGSHTGKATFFLTDIDVQHDNIERIDVVENKIARNIVSSYFKNGTTCFFVFLIRTKNSLRIFLKQAKNKI